MKPKAARIDSVFSSVFHRIVTRSKKMLQDKENDNVFEKSHQRPRTSSYEGDTKSFRKTVELQVIELSDEDTLTSSSASESQIVVEQSINSPNPLNEKLNASTSLPPPAKVLFLDGIRGLAAMLVVIQHTGGFFPKLHLGSVAVDAFFILSSFLLTWLFMRKSLKLIAEGATVRTWAFTLVDYLQKRFFRVYPLFAATVFVLYFMSPENQRRYYVGGRGPFNLFKALTFDYDHRYHVFWTLPLEIEYYFIIPGFVLVAIGMRRYWWVGALPLMGWIVHEGWTLVRGSHTPFILHLHTFMLGSLAAVVYVKLDMFIKKTGFQFRWWHTLLLRAVEGLIIALLLSVCFRGLLFDWVIKNPAPPAEGFPFSSVFMALVIVIEIIHPSCVSTMFEWSVLRYWGKISFSIYLLHTFIVETPSIWHQPYYFDRLFSQLFLVIALATTSYYLIEYPSQLMAQQISCFLAAREKNGSPRFNLL
ncbi:hypothetical protein DD238_000973 [Peronospora effusa]|uniref:Acyltransferase 3 domain-containing protein n=1 Tax=Peronospora effusa TaxID=542832 RepID=A0A3M6VVC6_9STRA|nr:hypothetical protein DD238_000973 [Peronospora effusa]